MPLVSTEDFFEILQVPILFNGKLQMAKYIDIRNRSIDAILCKTLYICALSIYNCIGTLDSVLIYFCK